MTSLLWALGAAFILILFVTFLPLGFTIKGKLMISFGSFVLSLVGLATVSIFPLWQTALMLLGLVYISAYFLNNRMGKLIFNNIPTSEEGIDEGFENYKTVYKEKNDDDNFVGIVEDLNLPDITYPNKEKETAIELSPTPAITTIEEFTDTVSEPIDEDISFFLEQNTEEFVNEPSEVTNLENDYLSDIESLLELESGQENLLELSPTIKDKLPAQPDEEEEEPLDDSLFDFLLAKKEVAADRDEFLVEIETKEKVSLQK